MKRTTFAAFLTLALLLSACSNGEPQTPQSGIETLVIGGMHPLTGDGAKYGIPLQRATEIALKDLNDAGGIGGKDLQVVWEDSTCTAKGGADAARKLVSQYKVILGGACSEEVTGAAPITEEAGVILMTPRATSTDVTSLGQFIFRTAPADSYTGKAAAEYARSAEYNTVSIITENTASTQASGNEFRESFKALGGSIATEDSYNTDASDFKGLVLKVVDIYPDAVYLAPQTPEMGIAVLKQLRAEGYKGPVITTDVLVNNDVITENAALLEGIIGITLKFNPNSVKAQRLFDAYRAQYGEEPPYPAQMAAAYDSVNLIADAIGANDGVIDADQIRRYLYDVQGYEGMLGTLTIDPNGDAILKFDRKKVSSGKIITLR